MKKRMCKVVAMMCSVALLMQFSAVAMTEETHLILDNQPPAAEETLSPEELEQLGEEMREAFGVETEPVLLGEDPERREENVKHFLRSDGAYTAVYYNEPIHYEKDGEWKDIDNTLVTNAAGYYQNQDNDFQVSMPAAASAWSPVRLTYEGHNISFRLEGSRTVSAQLTQPEESRLPALMEQAQELAETQIQAYNLTASAANAPLLNRSAVASKEAAEARAELVEQINEERQTLKKLSSRASYDGLLPGVDVAYDLQGKTLKESLILNTLPERESFSFFLNTGSLTSELLEDGSVELKDGETVVFTIAAPYMFDAAGEYSSDVEVALTPAQDGITYTLNPSREWLTDEKRVYPVTVDPTITVGGNSIFQTSYGTSTSMSTDMRLLLLDKDIMMVGDFSGVSLKAAIHINANWPQGRIIDAQMILRHTYDSFGNIKTISENGTLKVTYTYDQWNQLVKEVHNGGDTIEYTYDNGGNLLTKKVNGTVSQTYSYGNTEWKDLLTGFNGQSITYDAIGNPLSYNNGTAYTFTWKNGRQLSTLQKGDTSVSYSYNADGLRLSKTVNGTKTQYVWDGNTLLAQKAGSNVMVFLYNATGLYGFKYGGNTYFYLYNGQGDVTGILNSSGTQVVSYTYDAWGKPLTTTGSLASTIGQTNPIRYRGYYYDGESGLYYLQSRYYDPAIGRFINADGIIGANVGSASYNLCAYCGNNPVNYLDINGEFVISATVAATLCDLAIIALIAYAAVEVYNAYTDGNNALQIPSPPNLEPLPKNENPKPNQNPIPPIFIPSPNPAPPIPDSKPKEDKDDDAQPIVGYMAQPAYPGAKVFIKEPLTRKEAFLAVSAREDIWVYDKDFGKILALTISRNVVCEGGVRGDAYHYHPVMGKDITGRDIHWNHIFFGDTNIYWINLVNCKMKLDT